MPRVIVFQHSDAGSPGRLGATLRDHGFKLDIRRVDLPADKGGKPVPADLDDVAGVVAMGGPQSVTAPPPWMRAEVDFLRAAHEAALPIVGICLGHQMLAAALGGEVARMPAPECGFTRVNLTGPAQTETVTAGIAWSSMQFQSHEDEVSKPPPGAMVLASSERCRVQAFRAGMRTFAFQYHFELDRPMIASLAERTRVMLGSVGLSPDDLESQAADHYDRFAVLADRLCVNLVTYAFRPAPALI